MKKKFDITTAKKIINEYADKVNFYMKQTEVLKSQLEDMTTTLNINKNILYNHMLDNIANKDSLKVLNDLRQENERVSQKNFELNRDKELLESKLRRLQSDYDEKFLNEKSELDKLNEEIFLLQQKLYEKESAFVNLKREYEKNPISENNIKEIYITDPTKLNVELNNELNYARDIMAKVSKMLNNEKVKNEKLEKKHKLLADDFDELKRANINLTQIPTNNNNLKLNLLNNYEENGNFNSNNIININSKSSKITNNKSVNNQEISSNLNYSEISKTKCNSEFQKQKNIELSDQSKEFLSSDTESEKSENGSIELKFPDKIQMEKKDHKKSTSLIPKLDFSKVQEKYNSETMKKINVIPNKISKIPSEKNKKDKFEELEQENKNLFKQNEKLKLKFEKYKKGYYELKNKYREMKKSIKLSNHKVEILEMQIRRMTNRQSTEDVTNKRNDIIENTSMNNNLSDIYDHEWEGGDCVKTQEKETPN